MWGWIIAGVIIVIILFVVIGWIRGGRKESISQSPTSRRSLWDRVKDACCTRGR